jgi:hypothetical protein
VRVISLAAVEEPSSVLAFRDQNLFFPLFGLPAMAIEFAG